MLNVKKINEKIFLLGVIASMTLLYSNFYFGVEQGLVHGGGLFRLVIKTLVFMLLIYFMILNFVVTQYRLLIISFFTYVSIKNIISISYVDGEIWQIYNYLFFTPILFTKMSNKLLRETYYLVVIITCLMLIYDFFNPVTAFSNGGFVGGVGNTSSFGFLLLISSVIIRKRFFISTLLRVGTIFSGAGMVLLIAGLMQLREIFKSLNYFILTSLFLLVLILFFYDEMIVYSNAADHAIQKISDIFALNFEDSYSLKNRIKYNIQGWELFTENFAHILIGSLGDPVIFTGDGYYIALLATYGLIGFVLFAVMILGTQCYRGSKNFNVSSSRYIIVIFLFIFITNRLLDYWPMALIFLLALIHSKESEIYDKATIVPK